MQTDLVIPRGYRSRRNRLDCGMGLTLGLGLSSGASAGTGAFTPASRGGLLLWLRGDRGVTPGTGVAAWADQGASGFIFSNASGPAQPTVAANASYNNQLVLTASAAAFQMLTANTPITPAQPFTAYTLFNVPAPSGFQAILGGGAGCTISGVTSGLPYTFAGTLVSGGTGVGAPQLVCTIQSGGNGTIYESNSVTPVVGPAACGVGAITTMTLFGNAGATALVSGSIAEVIMYSGVDSLAQRQQIRDYVNLRYAKAFT